MNEKKFIVSKGNTTLASEMTLDDALLFIKAYIEKYYMEHLSLRITEMERVKAGDGGMNCISANCKYVKGKVVNNTISENPKFFKSILVPYCELGHPVSYPFIDDNKKNMLCGDYINKTDHNERR